MKLEEVIEEMQQPTSPYEHPRQPNLLAAFMDISERLQRAEHAREVLMELLDFLRTSHDDTFAELLKEMHAFEDNAAPQGTEVSE